MIIVFTKLTEVMCEPSVNIKYSSLQKDENLAHSRGGEEVRNDFDTLNNFCFAKTK